uniref:T-cell receptor T3 zeta chain n=1 Tax=Neolamprologus brichardi TaxID=32507 RepID=A0A3Q4IDX6_NEOBR
LTYPAMNMYDPQLCYILDGFLGIYGLIITGMFIKEKVCLMMWIKTCSCSGPERSGSGYLRATENGRPRGWTRKSKSGLSSATRDTYDSLQMQSLPPR